MPVPIVDVGPMDVAGIGGPGALVAGTPPADRVPADGLPAARVPADGLPADGDKAVGPVLGVAVPDMAACDALTGAPDTPPPAGPLTVSPGTDPPT